MARIWPAAPGSTLLFGAIMGFLWMGVGPLVACVGLKWQAMIQGLAFMSHQFGSFLGAYGGGLIYGSLGSYTIAWRIGVALVLLAASSRSPLRVPGRTSRRSASGIAGKGRAVLAPLPAQQTCILFRR